jgi:16S rRNA (uracil1498-N3)-methyltransferase
MPDPRLLIPETLAAGVRLRLEEARSRRLTTVLRLGVGAPVRVFNGADGEWLGRIEAVDKRGLDIVVEERLRKARSTPDLDLLFAPVKRQATDLIVEKATELGARRIRPVLTARTIAETVRLDRLAIIAREAAEQSERFDALEIVPAQPLTKVLDEWDAERILIFADEAREEKGAASIGERGTAQPILAALSEQLHNRAPSIANGRKSALLIGPEGGFDSSERRMLRALPFVLPVSLGPRILRAETAVIAALAVLQSVCGDWRSTETHHD